MCAWHATRSFRSGSALSKDAFAGNTAGSVSVMVNEVLRRKGGSKAKTFWFVKGVGKVKEDGDSLEELVAYEVQP